MIFLDELVGGAPPVPLKLFPEYEAMQRARGVKAAAPADLFFPDLAPRAPSAEAPAPMAADKLACAPRLGSGASISAASLSFLRGDAAGARKMRDAVAGIEQVSMRQSARTFWWTAVAFFDAIRRGDSRPDFGAEAARGAHRPADPPRRRGIRRRSPTGCGAKCSTTSPSARRSRRRCRRCRRPTGSPALIPSAEVLNADLVRLQPILRDAREQLAAAKEMWLKVTSGRADSLPKLQQTLEAVHANAAEIGNAPLTKLTASLVARLDKMPPSGNVSEPLAMEYATGILLAEQRRRELRQASSKEFPKQVEAMLARLDAAQAARPIPAATAPILDEMFRRAQERMLLTQVAREIQANLRRMEQVLDAFFRDHAKRAELATLGKDSQQIRGALTMLGRGRRRAPARRFARSRSTATRDPDAAVGGEDLELLAESLSGLGFYVEALEQQRPDRQRLIAPLLAKRLGEAPVAQADRRAETVEQRGRGTAQCAAGARRRGASRAGRRRRARPC